jgi:hypothetical protein
MPDESLEVAGSRDRSLRATHLRADQIRQYVHAVVGFRTPDARNEQHLAICPQCRELISRYALTFGMATGGETDGMRAHWPTSPMPRLGYVNELEADSFSPYWWFITPDRTGIVRQVTELGRLYSLDFVSMAAVSYDLKQAAVGFGLVGARTNLIRFDQDWPMHAKEIESVPTSQLDCTYCTDEEFALWIQGDDRPDIVARFVDIVSVRFRAAMRCFVAEASGGRFTLECRILPQSRDHRLSLIDELRPWFIAESLEVKQPHLEDAQLPELAFITKGRLIDPAKYLDVARRATAVAEQIAPAPSTRR